ncbi:MAG: glycosyltransferase, partial [Gemmatimonadales bacterium]
GLLWLSALIAPAAASTTHPPTAGTRQEPARPAETSGAPRELTHDSRNGPLFSVLVPTHNQAELLPATLDSLLAQTCPYWEAVVVDDGSTDSTPEVVAAYARRDPRIRAVRKPTGGTASALNAGLLQAQGEWICWLPSDGLFEPDKLAIHLAAIQAMPEIKFFHTRHFELNELTGVRSTPDTGPVIPPAELQLVHLFHTNYIHGTSIAAHRSVFEQVGGFNEKRRHAQDLDMWLRLGARFTSHFIDRCTCVSRIDPSPGAALHLDAGILDSTAACQDFLNTHTFADLFPRLNLSHAGDIPQALQAVLAIALDPDALINRGGCASALIGRMREWLSRSCPLELRPSVLAEYGRIAQAARDSNLPAWIKRALMPVHEAGKPYRYRPADPLLEMERHGAVRSAAGDREAASAIAEYVQARRGVGIVLTPSDETPATTDEAPGDGSSRPAVSTGASVPEEPAMPRPLRVLLVTHDASLDGMQAHTWVLAQELIRRGHQVCVAQAEYDLARSPGALVSGEHGGVPVPRVALHAGPRPDVESALTSDGGLSTLRNEFRSESGAAAFEQVLGAFEPDLVHFHHLLGFSAAALPVCTRRGLPAVLTLHDDWTLCEERRLLHANDTPCSGPETAGKCARCLLEYHPALDGARFLGPVTDHMQTRQDYLHVALGQANTIIVPTQSQLQMMIRYGYEPARLRLQPPGIRPFDPLPRQPAAGAPIAAAGTPGGRVRFVCLGTIVSHEGLDLAIHAFNMVAPRNASLEIHGEIAAPEFFRQIMAQVNPGVQVFYRGPYTDDDLPVILAHADVGIVPHRAGHGGTVMREFLHAGVPVIAPALAGISEIVRNGQNGLLFRPNDVGGLAEKITLLASQPARLESLRQGITPVRTLAEEATDLEALYREVHRRGASAQPASPAAIPVPSRAAQTLQCLFDAPDIAAALQQHAERLDGDLLALVQANARSARAEYKTELARGLDNLAAHIVQITGAREAGKRPLTIVAFSSEKPDDSCARLRALAPLGRQAGVRVQWGVRFEEQAVHVNTEAIGSADLILIQRFFPSPETQPALDRIFASGKPVLYDLDDLLIDVPATNPYAKVARRLSPNILEVISRADAVTVSSEELRSAILPHHSRVSLLPNLLDESQWPPVAGEPDQASSVVIGYSGTPTHQADLALVEKALERISRKYGKRVAFCFMGCATDRLLRLPGASVKNFVDYDAYLGALQEAKISIALAPLTDTRFNRCKSNIKWLEYSAAGIAGVYSDLPPYNDCITPGETGLLAGATTADWFDAIDDLVAHPEKRRRIAAAARQKVLTEHTLAARAHLWDDVYRGVLERKQATAATLKRLLVARDLPAALEEHAARLDSDLLRLA